ncbi:MAG TPA: carbamoyltransferase HypF [Vicinamibacterales bacterium]|nr:carbamoyltransferase HypF [Vicinamibacterales bacterium]
MRERLRFAVRGAVQGVGFRPFVYRLAHDLGLDGWVRNSTAGVFIEVEGQHDQLEAFRVRLASDRPPRAVIQSLEASWLDAAGHSGFQILESAHDGAISALVLPDIAICEDCRREIADRSNRRYRYPFTNCTNCGPRFSIIEALPYDRANTSMRRFEMCPACQREYDSPLDRRFHAQPNACPACGPQVALWHGAGHVLARQDDALRAAAGAIQAGRIVAVKGLGGFHLMTDARNDGAVRRLRERKHREEKPLALMYPDMDSINRHCVVSTAEARVLASPESPIVLCERRRGTQAELAASVAPGNPNLGVMLPYTPLHLVLMRDIGGPVVATSGNLSDEPICTDEREAIGRLGHIADLFLVHDRPIVRHVDDSIVRMMLDRELVLRRARGYAPLPIPLRRPAPTLLAVGAHLKNTVAATSGSNVFVSQHIGDLESAEACEAFVKVIADFQTLYELTPAAVVADLHPDYRSTRHARSLGVPVTHVQHHFAHVAACLAENDLEGPALGVSWDGTGYGPDGTVWGGEFLAVGTASFARVACLRPFRLPGGDRAIREPRRAALGLLHAMAGRDAVAIPSPAIRAFTDAERALLIDALARGVNSPVTTSAGRLCDAVASLVGLRQQASFEGQAAMELEFAITPGVADAYPFAVSTAGEQFAVGSWQAPPLVIDWEPTVRAVVGDVGAGVATGVIAGRVHNTLVEMIVTAAERCNEPAVVLTGGCFQNRYLTERAVARLRHAGFRPYWHQRIPPNDGGISLGQIAAYVRANRTAPAEGPTRREDESLLALR